MGAGDGGDDDGREHSNAFMKRRRRSLKITRIAIPSIPSWEIRKVLLGGGRLVIPLPAVRQEIRLLVLAEALTRRKLIADLRQWADGLETQQLSERSVVLVHGTNLRKHRNSALLERFQRCTFGGTWKGVP